MGRGHGNKTVVRALLAARRVMLVLAVALAAPRRDVAAAVLDGTPYSRPGRRLAPSAVAAAALLGVAMTLAVIQDRRVAGVPWLGRARATAGWAPSRRPPISLR